jgi:hypothetical protein
MGADMERSSLFLDDNPFYMPLTVWFLQKKGVKGNGVLPAALVKMRKIQVSHTEGI